LADGSTASYFQANHFSKPATPLDRLQTDRLLKGT
jgi:hypothetical protein